GGVRVGGVGSGVGRPLIWGQALSCPGGGDGILSRPSRLSRLSGVYGLLAEVRRTPHQDSGLDLPPSGPPPLLPPSPILSAALQGCPPHAAGIDIGAAEHWGAVPPGGPPNPCAVSVRAPPPSPPWPPGSWTVA